MAAENILALLQRIIMRRLMGVVVLMLTASGLAAQEANPPLELRIAIPVHHQHRSLNTADHFHVLVKNVSNAPLRLWSDKYSWGSSNLSFELVGEDGKVTKVEKKSRGWDKNFPDWLQLEPGDTYVLNVNFAEKDIWENPPAAGSGKKPTLVQLRAVYQVGPDEQSLKHAVWTGEVRSAVGTYAIW